MLIGQNGAVTSIPSSGSEKICVACEHWTGERELSYNGSGATSHSNEPAMCIMKRSNVYPESACTCNGKFKKWSWLR